jgi:hypothetical protein
MGDLTKRRRHWSIRLGQFGFSSFLVGSVLLGSGLFRPPLDGVGSLVKETPSAAYLELRQSSSGEVRLIEGKVGAENQVLEQGLVAYQRSHGVPDIRNEIVWSLEETLAPELRIEMEGGTVMIDPDYILFGDMREVTSGSDRYAGVASGDTVLVIGAVFNSGNEVRIQAQYLILGSLQENQPVRFDVYKIAAGAFLAALGLGTMGWLLSKGYKPFGDPKTGR